MSRGKYKSAAEARRVREGALSEVEASRRQIARLTAENKELRETLTSEREANTLRVRELNALVAEGSAPEVIALREELALSREDAKRARHDIALSVQALMDRGDLRATFAFYAECADILGLTVQELMPRTAGHSRRSRRAAAETLRSLASLEGLFSPAGLARAFDGFEHGYNQGLKAPR